MDGHGLWGDDDDPYIATAYQEGGTLSALMTELIPHTQEDLIRVMRDTTIGVIELHAQKVIHCDIKPSNVGLSQQATAKVLDLGLSCYQGSRVMPDMPSGGQIIITGSTLPYSDNSPLVRGTPGRSMPPEAYISDTPVLDSRDIWSIGVTAYAIFTKKFPFKTPPALSGALAYQQAAREKPEEISAAAAPEEIRRIVMAAIDPESKQRPNLQALFKSFEAAA